MAYTRPDVYINDVSAGMSVQAASATIGILVGVTPSGPLGSAGFVESWTEFIEMYANGLESPFLAGFDLSYAAYGFFQNGGNQLYVVRVAKGAVAETGTGTTGKNETLKFTSKYKGSFGTVVTIAKSADWVATTNEVFDVTIKVSDAEDGSVTLREVTLATIVDTINSDVKAKNWVVAEWVASTATALFEETITLSGGNNGTTGLADSDYISVLSQCDSLDDASFIAIPGITTAAVNAALMEYGDAHKLIPIIEEPVNTDYKTIKTYRKSISAFGGVLLYPWINVSDPLTGGTRAVPACGHYMGIWARTVMSRGIGKAPAGIDAIIRGALSLAVDITDTIVGSLNPVGIVCLMARTNVGLVVWGARGLSNDSTMRYVTDTLINYTIKKSLYSGTQFAVFEQNDEQTWGTVTSVCKGFLETLRLERVLRGEAAEAYYVVCDDSINTQASIDAGIMNVEIGYAPNKPAEFVVIKLAHQVSAS